MYATVIIWATMTFFVLRLLTFILSMQIILIDLLIRLGPVDLVLFTFLLELANLNLNVKKVIQNFRETFGAVLHCITTPYLIMFTCNFLLLST